MEEELALEFWEELDCGMLRYHSGRASPPCRISSSTDRLTSDVKWWRAARTESSSKPRAITWRIISTETSDDSGSGSARLSSSGWFWITYTNNNSYVITHVSTTGKMYNLSSIQLVVFPQSVEAIKQYFSWIAKYPQESFTITYFQLV